MPITTLNLENAASDASVRRALASVSSTLVKSRRIVVVTGAGISCSCGIPVSTLLALLMPVCLSNVYN
jgi:NAD-dependent histone deacetylase SIR2